MAEYLAGIDFGACNLKAVHFDGKKIRPVQLNADQSGIKHAPNFIYYNLKKDGDIDKIIGQVAINRSITELKPDEINFVANVKRKLEISDWKQKIFNLNREVNAQEVIGDIFGAMKKFFRNKNEVIRVVLTTPVCFSEIQRKIIRQAAEDSGIVVDAMINEPFAALMALKDLEQYDGKLILIFDFGGSTLDISVAKIEAGNGLKITELAAAGLRIGGLDIDKDIYEKILLPAYKEKFDSYMPNTLNREDFLLNFAQNMKETLFNDDEDFVESESLSMSVPEELQGITLQRADVEKVFAEYKTKIFKLLDALFEDLEEGDEYHCKEDVVKIFPFGGTCKIPYVGALLEEYFGTEIFDGEDFNFEDNEILADGLENLYLAVAGGAINFLKNRLDGENISVTNVVPYCIGYGRYGKFIRGIAKNKPFGFKSRQVLPLSYLEEIAWEVPIYQCFNNQIETTISDDGAAVYVGKISLNRELYERQESPIMEMRVMREGKIRLVFFDNQTLEGGTKELVEVERHIWEVGS